MKRYRVVNDCVGMPFNKRYFSKGEIFEVADDVDPASSNFELIDENVPSSDKPKQNPDAFSMKELQDQRRRDIDAAAGFASNIKEIQPDVDPAKKVEAAKALEKKEPLKGGKSKGKKTAG